MLPIHNNYKTNLLLIITGPTAVGKTEVSLHLAKAFTTEIISCDSRQFYKEMQKGTAVPSLEELTEIKHHFIGHLSVIDRYNVSMFEFDALRLLEKLFKKYKVVVMTGGSGLYINAICHGIDELPDPDYELRKMLNEKLENEGIYVLQSQLMHLDPEYFAEVDKSNSKRLLRAIEVCLTTGKPYSKLRKGMAKERPFNMLKISLNRDRPELFKRISERTDQMMANGLLEEVENLMPFRKLNALNTVGYKELFHYIDGAYSLEQAIENIKTNTRRYAKRQLTWFKKDQDILWFHPDEKNRIVELVKSL